MAEIYITFRGIFPNLDVPSGVRSSNLVHSTRLVELSSPVSPETLTEPTEACQLRPKRPFRGNELINSLSRRSSVDVSEWPYFRISVFFTGPSLEAGPGNRRFAVI